MNAKLAKKIRKEARIKALDRDKIILPELKQFLNHQSFIDRCKVAFRILRGVF